MSVSATDSVINSQKNPALSKPSQKSDKTNPMHIEKYFSDPEVHPFDQVEWELRTISCKRNYELLRSIFQFTQKLRRVGEVIAQNIVEEKYYVK